MAHASEGGQSSGAAMNSNRWLQLLFGIGCMVMVANLQYGWTLFVNPIDMKFHWGRAAIQVAFSIFVLTETWLVPAEGYLVDKFGPRIVTVVGGLLVGIAWSLNSVADSLVLLYVSAAIGGVGAGAVYGTCVGNALKWFPDHRGLAAGLTAAGFGAGSALTIIPIQNMIKDSGYEHTFLVFGIIQGVLVMLMGYFLRAPAGGPVPVTSHVAQTAVDFTPQQTVRTPLFWMLYVMFVLVATGGLMATAQLALIAKDFNVADVPVSLIGLTLPALTFALSLDRVLNGLCRPFFGWVSDHIGRENTMTIAFALEGASIWLLATFGTNPLAFVVLSGLVFFGWGEIYSLFPAISGDAFGRKFATTNYGLLYTAKGTASLLVPVANIVAHAMGSWMAVFFFASAFDFTAAILAILVLKRMVRPTLSPSARAAAA